MNDQELKLALAKMLPEKLYIINGVYQQFASWSPGGVYVVGDTEWLHVCCLIERKLDNFQEEQKYAEILYNITAESNSLTLVSLFDGHIETSSRAWLVATASWQQRAEALCKLKERMP